MRSYWIITLTVYPEELARLALLAVVIGVVVWRIVRWKKNN